VEEFERILSIDIIGNKCWLPYCITGVSVVDGGIQAAGYEEHKPLP